MLFLLSPNSPRFQVFVLLNAELLHFIEHSVSSGTFRENLFTEGEVGKACWNNSKSNNQRANNDLTKEKFEKLYIALQNTTEGVRRQLFESIRDHQNLQLFFSNPNRGILDFLPKTCFEALKNVTTHLYCSTKEIQAIKDQAGGVDINAHFNAFRTDEVNGNICKACGMRELAPFRAGVQEEEQWRADYDHQLCKSKYPIFAVHPDNLIPLCDVCNQDAKKAKDLFRDNNSNNRLSFYPYLEEARNFIDIDIERLRDPEPMVSVIWSTMDEDLINKLNTWDEIYEIRSRVEGKLRSLELVVEDEIHPIDLPELQEQIIRRARPIPEATLKRKEWAFWYQKLFYLLSQIDLAPFEEKLVFFQQQGLDGGEYILGED